MREKGNRAMKETTTEVSCLVLILFCTLKSITCQGYLTVLPETVVDVLNNQAHFHCEASSSYAIYWEVDGTEARVTQIQARGITFRTTGATTSVLTVESSLVNNNTEVVCIALNVETGETVQRSPIAYLIIQGLLAAPSNLSVISTNLTAIHITWTPPFTLNITNTDQDILFYTIKITNHDSGEVSFDNSSYPGYTMLSEKAFQCDMFEFQVTGWNSAGEGNISKSLNATFEKPLTFNSPSVANTTVNNSIRFYCEYACISNTLVAWFIEGKLDIDVKLGELLVRRLSNRDEICRNPAAAETSLHYIEILEISPLTSFDHPIPVYCAYILLCNNLRECKPNTCFSDSVGELGVVESKASRKNNHNNATPVTEIDIIIDTTESSPSKNNLYGVIAGLISSLVFNVLIVVIALLLLMKIISMRAKRMQAPNQAIYSEVLEGAIYDQVQAPSSQQQPSTNSSEVKTEACPAYNVTFSTNRPQ